VLCDAEGAAGSLSIRNSTVTGNTNTREDESGGVRAASSSIKVSIANSVIAENSGAQCEIALALAVNAGNASSDSSCGFAHENVRAGLGGLSDNRGAVPIGPNGEMGNVLTMAIDTFSPLWDAGDFGVCEGMDGRG